MIFGGRRKSEEESPRPAVSASTTEVPSIPVSPSTHNFEAVLGTETRIEGTLACQGNIRIDGKFTGTLSITGNVLVGESATIEADINANNVSIAGTVRGNVSGKRVQLLRTGKVWGDITAASLTTEDGAFIDGKVSMSSQPIAEPVDLDAPTFIPAEVVSTDDQPTETSEDIIEGEVEEENKDD